MKTKEVYFIQAGENGNIKIGVSNDVEYRIRVLQTGNAEKLNILLRLPFPEHKACEFENQMHQRFSHIRLNGEWFAPKEFLLKSIEVMRDYGVNGLEKFDENEAQDVIDVVCDSYSKLCDLAHGLKKEGNAPLYRYLISEVKELLHDLQTGHV